MKQEQNYSPVKISLAMSFILYCWLFIVESNSYKGGLFTQSQSDSILLVVGVVIVTPIWLFVLLPYSNYLTPRLTFLNVTSPFYISIIITSTYEIVGNSKTYNIESIIEKCTSNIGISLSTILSIIWLYRYMKIRKEKSNIEQQIARDKARMLANEKRKTNNH